MDTLGIAVGAGVAGAAIARTSDAGMSLVTGLTIAFAISVAAGVMMAVLAPRIDRR
jgi:Na+-transporting methylmalonyl-CoA/oxaloacetate decarboxylase beta subunit